MHRLPASLLASALLALAVPVAAQDAPGASDQESWNAHAQATYVRQIQPAFHSPYEGANSLRGAAGASYSITATAFLGLRLGPSTELYVDPEMAQGVPLSGLLGLAAFPDGELAKTSGSSPTFYRARLFVRHTFELGGEATVVEGDANQLKSTYDARRLVVTAGNVSVLDLFDQDVYAHDPRTQFLNWVGMADAAYDYPADARGYTNGLALEYDDGAWSTRVGRFAEPRLPNGRALDNDLLRHYGDQVEVARTLALGGRPGNVRVLAFRSEAVMATWADALAAAPAGTVPSLDAVRDRAQVKRGIGIDLDQQVADDVGVFLRAMRADGRTETFAFTEADASAAAGVSVGGGRWSRGKDRVGFSVAQDTIASAHRAYLERGGMTSFLGDGALRYGPERLLEAYYDAALGAGFSLTADVQRIANPGYNKDRGPASFFALRLHWEV